MRIYISGKMFGCPDLNRPAFDAAERRLTAQGHFVVNPVNISVTFGEAEEIANSFEAYYKGAAQTYPNGSFHLAQCVMDADLAAVRSCGAIYLLRGWETSRGAKRELAEALAHGLTVMQEGGEE
jgi:hypothetical protein